MWETKTNAMEQIMDKLKSYQQCVNQIEDLFEYRYVYYTKDNLKIEVMKLIDKLAKELEENK